MEDFTTPTPSPRAYSLVAVACIFSFPALGGLLFGYDIGATSYVLTQLMSDDYSGVSWSGQVSRSQALQGLVTSAGVGGALIASCVVFRVADLIGRRRELMLGAWLYIGGALTELAAGSPSLGEGAGLAVLLGGRVIYGLGCGFAMHGAPTYISEMAPPTIRGLLVSLKEGMIVLGMLLGYVAGYAVRFRAGAWRYVYGAAAGPAVLMLIGCWGIPPSARWLVLTGRKKEAAASLAFVYGAVPEVGCGARVTMAWKPV